ncbi:hypothetical protein CMO94_03300 [Candidatus Woesearchaeota archaeon]|jgi:peroxiredoxin|nr:hypothetical protein [Candidatus Woesearchaeota archaeon]|tara:strand:+ start:476 stop:1021 length:546 start_codon:yes stop_codon:yes gene_type:complete
MIKKLLIAIFLLSIVFVYGCTGGSSHNPNIQGQAVAGNVGTNLGNLAPDFTIKTIDGKTVSLSQLTNDKPTVLYFFATWCPHCAKDLSAVSKVYPQYSDKVNFLAIDLDAKESNSAISNYRQRMNLNNIDFAQSDRSILSKYNVVYTTTKYFIGGDGTILNKGVGEVDQNTWHQIFQSMSQ